jgi:hypothetical protein
MKRAVVVLLFAGVLASASSAAWADGKLEVQGTFTTSIVPCDTLCTHSIYMGDLIGTSDFILISLEPTKNPEVMRYVGNLVLHTADGDLIGEDVGYWNIVNGVYNDVFQVMSGTGVYKDDTAVFRLHGFLDPVTGVGSSIYSGTIYLP